MLQNAKKGAYGDDDDDMKRDNNNNSYKKLNRRTTSATSQAIRPRAVLRETAKQSAQGCTLVEIVLLLGCTSGELYISLSRTVHSGCSHLVIRICQVQH